MCITNAYVYWILHQLPRNDYCDVARYYVYLMQHFMARLVYFIRGIVCYLSDRVKLCKGLFALELQRVFIIIPKGCQTILYRQ